MSNDQDLSGAIKGIKLALTKKPMVEVGATFISYEQAVEICDKAKLVCTYWAGSKVYVFQTPAGKVKAKDRITMESNARPHQRNAHD